ncbi:c-type cytochrome [Flavobacterium sp.]|uniref:c-type cytochrome n=1 Tax=Flavobacterium sp. TaxID=239 RepID=UPI0025CFF49F|nr:c-type cytochrome [Flavobacterium sp.]
MKYKIVALLVLVLFLNSCASKSSVPTTQVKKTESIAAVSTLPKELSAELAAGKLLYENNCAKCHRLYDTKEFSSEEWKPLVARMQKKAHLDDLQGQRIYNYATMN